MIGAGGKPHKQLGITRVPRSTARPLWFVLLPFCVQLSECSSSPKPPPPTPPPPPPVVMLSLIGSAEQNPDINGAPSPVAVRIIQLMDPNRFEHVDAYAFMDNAQQALGSDAPASENVFVSPSEQRSIRIDPKPGVTAIGVAALYRDIDNAQWRAVAPVASSGTTKLSATIGRLTVTLQPAP